MKTSIKIPAISLAVLLCSAPLLAKTVTDYPAGAAANGIGGSRHNLGSFGRVLASTATTEICVFCHTPHHSNTSVSPAPLWNRVNSAAYTAYGTTLGGTYVASVGSTSLACLSCHDGITTFDTLINAPGAGGVVSGGINYNWKFKMPSSWFAPRTEWDHFDPTGTTGWACANCHVYSFGGENPAVRLTIGTKLSDDHPVSIPYSSDRASLRPASTVINTINLTTGLATSASTAYSGNLAQNRWALKGFISDTARISDLLRNGKVECTSCHDPHFRNLSWDETEFTKKKYPNLPTSYCTPGEDCTDGQFLRRVGGNTGSAICLTCHNK